MKYKDKYLKEKDAKEYAQKSFENIRKQNVELLEQIEHLQEQLNEANAIIDLYFPKDKKINAVCVKPINDYREKWGVK